MLQVARIAFRARHPGGAADGGRQVVPRRVGMVLTDPAAVFFAEGAVHEIPHIAAG